MKSRLLKSLLTSAFVFFGTQAYALVLTPGDMETASPPISSPSNCEPGCVEDQFGLAADSLTLLYKADVGGSDSGTYANFYNTTFSNTASDPSNALIQWLGGQFIACPECYLAVKDGNHAPIYYFYDLAGWNGKEDISLTGFWPDKGAISHVSIWGDPGNRTPEPGTIALLGLGLVGVAFARRRKQA